MNAADHASSQTRDLLALTLVPGLGPVLIGRAIKHLGSPGEVLAASPEKLRTVPGIGAEKAKAFFEHRHAARAAAEREISRAAEFGARLIGILDADYPPLLAEIQDPPPILYVRGTIDHGGADRFALAVVGSRSCTQYGREQTSRFAGMIASSGITIVSGGARGIDASAHEAALRGNGRTIVVLGSGLAKPYPPENIALFDRIVAEGRGAIVSELPIDTPPTPENFPTRNRIISGLSLGVLLIEAAKGSGSLITARLAAEDHGREVFAIPGRVDSAASEGTNELIKSSTAHLVTSPADVIASLESAARHLHDGTHGPRYAKPDSGLFDADSPDARVPRPPVADLSNSGPATDIALKLRGLTDVQRSLHAALEGGALSIDELTRATGLPAHQLRADLTILELRRVVVRTGSKFERAGG